MMMMSGINGDWLKVDGIGFEGGEGEEELFAWGDFLESSPSPSLQLGFLTFAKGNRAKAPLSYTLGEPRGSFYLPPIFIFR